jgi:hypothetical protein
MYRVGRHQACAQDAAHFIQRKVVVCGMMKLRPQQYVRACRRTNPLAVENHKQTKNTPIMAQKTRHKAGIIPNTERYLWDLKFLNPDYIMPFTIAFSRCFDTLVPS